MRTAYLSLTIFSVLGCVLIFFTATRYPTFPRDHLPPSIFGAGHVSHGPPVPPPPPPKAIVGNEPVDWTFDYKRDARNYGLSEEQCLHAFPLLYKEIDRAVEQRRNDTIALEDVDTGWRGDGIVRAMIWDNQLYILENRGVWDNNHRPRSLASLHSLHRAITASSQPLPNIEFTITDHDAANFGDEQHTTWSYARLPENTNLWLMPDFGNWAWPGVGLRSYAELQTLIRDSEVEFVDKEPKLVWRGSVAVGSRDVRAALLDKSKNRSWSDVQSLDWGNKTDIEEKLIGMEEHCGYMFVAQTEGNTYSGRLKYLLNCESVLVSHELKWIEHFHHLLESDGEAQNFVLVERDFSDLEKQVESLLTPNGIPKAEAIAANARNMFRERYLSPAAEACYWRQMVRGWAEVQGFETEFWREVQTEKGGKKVLKRKPRGVPFESYVIMEAVEWDLPAKPRKICEYD